MKNFFKSKDADMKKKDANTTEVPPPVEPAPTEPAQPGTEQPVVDQPVAEQPAVDPRDKEIAELKDRLLRLQADFDNFRKRTVRDRDDMSRRAAEKILKELLPIADHFELGIQAAHKNHIKHAVVDGFEGVLKQFLSVLEKSGVTPIETKGQPFDPHSHECVAHIPSEEHPENIVIEETRKGYRLGTYLLRASQVIVSTGSPTAKAPEEKPADDKTTEG